MPVAHCIWVWMVATWVEVEVHGYGGVEERQTGRGLDEEVAL